VLLQLLQGTKTETARCCYNGGTNKRMRVVRRQVEWKFNLLSILNQQTPM
jgi:hypothetical protein